MQLRPDLYESRPRSKLIKLASGEATPELVPQVEELNKMLKQTQLAYDILAYGNTGNSPSTSSARYTTKVASYLDKGYDLHTANRRLKRTC
jgi:hypothetical protein